MLFLQTGSGKAFGLNKQQPLHHIAYSERWHLFPSKKNLPDSSERNKVQTLPCSIQYFGTKIYLISHICKLCKAVARTKLLFRMQTSLDVWSLCMSMWLLLRIKIAQVSHHLQGFLYCIGMHIQHNTSTDALPILCDIFRISFVSSVTRNFQCQWSRIPTCSHIGHESD